MATQNQLKLSAALGDGQRSTKFDALLVMGQNFSEQEKTFQVLASTSVFPSVRMETTSMKYKGRTIPLKGDLQYDNTWSCDFYLSEDHSFKLFLEDWLHQFQNQRHSANFKGTYTDSIKSSGLYKTAYIVQRSFDDTRSTVTYEMMNVFPKEIGTVQVDYSSVGQILKFSCTFGYSHYEYKVHEDTETQALADKLLDMGRSAISKGVNQVKGVVDNASNAISAGIAGVANNLKDKLSSKKSKTSDQKAASDESTSSTYVTNPNSDLAKQRNRLG